MIICTFVESSWNECNPVAWQPKKWQVQVGSTLYELPLLFTVIHMQTGEEEEEGDMNGMSTHVIALHIYTYLRLYITALSITRRASTTSAGGR